MFTSTILHNYHFQFLLGITVIPRETEDNGDAEFGGVNKVEYLCILLALKLKQEHHFILKQTQDGCGLTGPESVVTNLKLCFPSPHFKDKAKAKLSA